MTMEKLFTEETIAKLKAAKTVEELMELTKEKGKELTREEAEMIFKKMHLPTEQLTDDALEKVSGGIFR